MSNEFLTVIQVVSASLITHYLTKLQYQNASKQKVFMSQLKYIYTPLFKAVQNLKFMEEPNNVELSKVLDLFNTIADKHLELVDPELEGNMLILQTSLYANDKRLIKSSMIEVCDYISFQYEHLRKKLLLPNASIMNLFALKRFHSPLKLAHVIVRSTNWILFGLLLVLWSLTLVLPYLFALIKQGLK